MASEIISRCIIIVFGLLYPAYRSYKAIKSRSAPLYVKWMMYWIVFAIFYNVETFSDLLLSWFPMYYEMKAIFVIWLLSPSTQGSQVLYQMYIHPHLLKHEEEIELALQKVKSQSYTTLLSVGAQSVNLALQGAIAGQTKLANELRKSYSFDAADSIQPQMLSAEDEYDGRELDDGNSPCNELRQSQYEKHLSKQAKLNSSPSFQQRAPVINRHVRSSFIFSTI
ncbi:receptor expression-enhancing protein 1-like isoform X2 [Watersipora subatra]|uniref:receptor expression-enhancing protein 1-like isoform X2 n=1 Tax=Watersipora subatra TaxID=2589382 RepID=UPI00355B2C25